MKNVKEKLYQQTKIVKIDMSIFTDSYTDDELYDELKDRKKNFKWGRLEDAKRDVFKHIKSL